jgi:hypothetical protein
VLRDGDRYIKVLRAGRAEAPRRRHRIARDAVGTDPRGFVIPTVVDIDEAASVLGLEAVAGRPMLAGPDPITAGARCGVALREWAAVRLSDLDEHDAADEIAVLRRWRGTTERFSTLAGDEARRYSAMVDHACDALAELDDRPRALVHRDLHDGQVLDDPTGRVALLDLDTVVRGDPALDIGNLLAHIDLAVHEGRLPQRLAEAVAEAFLAGRAPSRSDRTAIAVYRQAARLRLVAVHSFRPSTRRAACALLNPL